MNRSLILYLLMFVLCSIFVQIHSLRDELMDAVHSADLKEVILLLSLDPDIISSRPPVLVNRKEDNFGRTSIMVCGFNPGENLRKTDKECVSIAKLLVHHGANVTIVDSKGWDALSLSAVRGFYELSKYFIKRNISTLNKDENGMTALMKAGAHGHFKVFDLLLSNGADIKAMDNKGLTALNYVVNLGLLNDSYIPFVDKVLNSLEKRHIAVDSVLDSYDRTVLMSAVINDHFEMTQLLIKHQSNPNLVDQFGVSVLTMSQTKSTPLQQLLIEASAVHTERSHAQWLASTESSDWSELDDGSDRTDSKGDEL